MLLQIKFVALIIIEVSGSQKNRLKVEDVNSELYLYDILFGKWAKQRQFI